MHRHADTCCHIPVLIDTVASVSGGWGEGGQRAGRVYMKHSFREIESEVQD